MIEAGLKELSAALAQKKISSVELTTLFLDRIEQHNPTLNAFITLDRERTLAQARAADALLAKVGADRATALQGGRAKNALLAVADGGTASSRTAANMGTAAPGQAASLIGIPLAHKDIFCTAGWRTSCGSKMLANFVSPYDAHVVARCNAAGMVMLGKCNMDEFAMGSRDRKSVV